MYTCSCMYCGYRTPCQRNKYLWCPSCKILGTILEVNMRRIQTNKPENKKTNDQVKSLHPRYDVDILYVSRKLKERGHTTIENSVDASIQLEDYIEKHGGRLLTATNSNTDDTRMSWTTITRKQKWHKKQFSGRFKPHLTRESMDVARKGKL